MSAATRLGWLLDSKEHDDESYADYRARKANGDPENASRRLDMLEENIGERQEELKELHRQRAEMIKQQGKP